MKYAYASSFMHKISQVPYYDVLLDVPFKGEESPLRAMEHAEVISIGMLNGVYAANFNNCFA